MIVKNFGYLIALDQEGHFGRAAKSCNVSQPTLSAGIKQLEQDLGVEIVRHGRRYDGLTSEGETVLAWAKKIESNCEGLERDLSAQKRGLEVKFAWACCRPRRSWHRSSALPSLKGCRSSNSAFAQRKPRR